MADKQLENPIELAEIKMDGNARRVRPYNNDFYEVIAEDAEFLGILFRENPEEAGKETFQWVLFDQNLNEITGRKNGFPHKTSCFSGLGLVFALFSR